MRTFTQHKIFSFLTICLAVVMVLTAAAPALNVQAGAALAPAQANAPLGIYADELGDGWQNWSWNANINLNNSSPVQSGSRSIAVSITQGWGALYLHDNSPLSTTGYTHLEFYIHGGRNGGQKLWVIANHNTDRRYELTAPRRQWVKVSIPLESLGSPSALSDLFWQDATGNAQAQFYLDSIVMVDNNSGPAPTTPAPTTPPPAPTTPAPTPTSPPSTTYFETLPPGSALPSDAECAALVKSRPENKGANQTYNNTPGNQGLASDFFGSAVDPRANSEIASRVTGNFTGTTDEILQWAACKWGVDEDMVRAQAAVESWWRQDTKGDWTSDASRCAPGHGLGVDGRPGQCPESFGILQNRYPYEQSSWPGIDTSTAFNADTTYAIWRACYEGYEWWLNDVERGWDYSAGDAYGCMGRWFSGRWHTQPAEYYISRVQETLNQRIWESPNFQEP